MLLVVFFDFVDNCASGCADSSADWASDDQASRCACRRPLLHVRSAGAQDRKTKQGGRGGVKYSAHDGVAPGSRFQLPQQRRADRSGSRPDLSARPPPPRHSSAKLDVESRVMRLAGVRRTGVIDGADPRAQLKVISFIVA